MRYIIGIDLGTTNSAVAFVDTQKPVLSLQQLSIPQLVAPGRVETLPTLPSFCYLVAKEEWSRGSLQLPWKEETITFVGQFAKLQGARVPTRAIQSAKSWLCNVAANRRDKILPIEAADLSQRLSPVEVSSKYLIHIRDTWNATIAKGDVTADFEEQEIILTVPASFDEVARALTVEAARQAGYINVTILEEPQAAFYSWISQNENHMQKDLKANETILVCDVGGGTTDFSLIEVHQKDEGLIFQRMAVGDHLLLGGDNMDATLAHAIEKQLDGQGGLSLHSTQWLQLLAEVRAAKEHLLNDHVSKEEHYPIVIQGHGSSVVKGSLTMSVPREQIEQLLMNGFFGQYDLKEALQLRKSRGFRTVGLPYEDEPSITKHLAHFLQQAGQLAAGKKIDYLLFNGGAMKPTLFQQAIHSSLCRWFPGISPTILSSASLDLAVSRGAAYYGKARRGLGVKIGGGLPRTYYLKIDVRDPSGIVVPKALTLLPRGSDEGASYQSEAVFALRPNTPVAFHLLTSHVRLEDKQGEMIEIDEKEMQRLPPIQTVLRFGKKQIQETNETIPVKLGIRLTVIGTIEMWLESQKSNHQWHLEFQVRSASGQDNSLISSDQHLNETYESQYLECAQQAIEGLFNSVGSKLKPNQIMEKLEEYLNLLRRDWSPSILRGLWDSLIKCAPKRKVSQEHEARWWNLAGFFLRPGFGFPLDDFRIKEVWKIILGDLKAHKNQECQIQQWICFRRIAGGLNKGQQMQIASELFGDLLSKSGKIEIKNRNELYAYSEKIRALAAMERLELNFKIRLGEALIARIKQQEAAPYDYWSLGRIGARHLMYGSIGQVIPREICEKWVEQLLKVKDIDSAQLNFVLGQLGRKTDHRELNLSDGLVAKILEKDLDGHLHHLLMNERVLTQSEQEQVFGDKLPAGLLLEL